MIVRLIYTPMAEPALDAVRAMVSRVEDDSSIRAYLSGDPVATAALAIMRDNGVLSARVPFRQRQIANDEYEYYMLMHTADSAGERAVGLLQRALGKPVDFFSMVSRSDPGSMTDVYDVYIHITVRQW